MQNAFESQRSFHQYTHAAYSTPSYLYYGKLKILSKGTQQKYPERAPPFATTIHDLLDQLDSKLNVWYLDDSYLTDNCKIVLN